eukprot:7380188-Prymnesium_polylepis.1
MVPVDTERCRTGGSQPRSCTTKSRLALARRKVGSSHPAATPNAGFAGLCARFPLHGTSGDSGAAVGRCGKFCTYSVPPPPYHALPG